jgi:CRISPR/Cas system-associated exonuclease Cas4 (RecB family)
MNAIALLSLILAGGVLLLIALLRASRDVGGKELDGASLVLNEETLQIERPILLSGRPDQVWRTREGLLVPVDTKKRRAPRAFASDAIQLSAYALLLKAAPRFRGTRVADHGFVRVEGDSGAARFIRVPLLGEDAIIARHERATTLLRGAAPHAKPSKALCAGCGHRGRCKDAA